VSFQPRDVPVGPVSFRIGDGELIPGLEEVLVGMAPGGRRRALVPPELGYTSSALQPQPPTFATRRQLANHSRESLLFEVQLLRVNGGR
jgi:FKBP-type peptidyl-prolyl cis-trans isomerase